MSNRLYPYLIEAKQAARVAGKILVEYQGKIEAKEKGPKDLVTEADLASQKAIEEYTYRIPGPAESWLYDILRASIICKSYKQMNDINKFL